MEAVISNFRMGRHNKSERQMVILVKGITTKEKAKEMKNKKVSWKSPSGKIIKGKIISPHGNSGALKAEFERGMPGQSIGTKVEIE